MHSNRRSLVVVPAVVVAVFFWAACNDGGVGVQNSLCSVTGACPDPLVSSVGIEDGNAVCRCVATDSVSCGNSRVEPGEACDDGNSLAGDGCFQCQRGDCGAGQTRECATEKDMIGVCRKGTQRCIGGVWESTCPGAVEPSDETCNGKDDNCDGVVDEGVAQSFFIDEDGDGFGSNADGGMPRMACTKPSGYSLTNNDCNDEPGIGANIHPGADEICDSSMRDENCNGEANEGCLCPVVNAIQPCCGSRGTQTCQGMAGWGPCSVQGVPELCNGIDEDCDTVADNLPLDGGTLCSIAGQVCGSGACACGAGEAVCGGACIAVGGSCSSGVGACRRMGTTICRSGAGACDAVPADAGIEVCDGIDNNCDGTVDEGTFISCYTDGDGDRRSANTTVSMQCPDLSRPTFGNCPAGFVAPSAALATNDCDDTSSAKYQLLNVRTDGDSDSHCIAMARMDCAGAQPNVGTRLVTACLTGADDCDDTAPAKYQLLSVRTDGDSDSHCVAAARMDCAGAQPNVGTRLATTCLAGADDCDDTAPAKYQQLSVRTDADNDTHCVGTAVSECSGAGANPGKRVATACAGPDDCSDADGARYQMLSVRTDGDGDSYCIGAVVSECSGTGANAGRRLSSSCSTSTDDCSDTDGALFQNLPVRADGDGDTYCVGSVLTQCSGANPRTGYRLSGACAGDDCDDGPGKGDRYKLVSVRNDFDSDGFCAPGAPFNACVGGNGPVYSSTFLGFPIRAAFNCAADDCGDFNGNVTTDCSSRTQSSQGWGHCCCLGCNQPNPWNPPIFSGTCPTGYKLRTCSLTRVNGLGPQSLSVNDGIGTPNFICQASLGCGVPFNGCEGSTAQINAICEPCTFSNCING